MERNEEADSGKLPFEKVDVVRCDGSAQQYEVGEPQGRGGFGDVYKGSLLTAAADDRTATITRQVAIKFQKKKREDEDHSEWKVYEALVGTGGLPEIHGHGEKDGYFFLIMDLLGKNLAQVRKEASPEVVARVAVEAISILEKVHSKKCVHRDVQPKNLLLGPSGLDEPLELFLVDFGLAKRWEENSENPEDRYDLQPGFFEGTLRYASVNAHLGRTLSRRDDLESLAYTLAFLLQGKLPWQGEYEEKGKEKERFFVGRMKAETTPQSLFPSQEPFAKFFEHAVNLGFDEKPDYDKCRSFFGNQGAEAAAAVSRPPTNRLRTGKPAAQWVTVYDPRLPMKQRCHHNVPEELLPGFIAKDKEQKLSITSVASCADKWALIADEGNQFGSQVHKISQELLPKKWIWDQWNSGFNITAVAGSREGKLLVVMSQNTRYSKQEYVHDDLFPSSWVEEKRKDGRFITSMATSKGRWAVVMSVDPSVEEQAIELDFGFPVEGVSRRWAAGYRITAVAATMEQVAVVMNKVRPRALKKGESGRQVVQRSNSFPTNRIREQQDKDFYVASVCYGRTAS